MLAFGSTASANEPSRGSLLDELGRGRVVIDAETGNVSFVTGSRARPAVLLSRLRAAGGPRATARAFVERYGRLFGIADGTTGLRLVGARVADGGSTFVRFEQLRAGVPVIGGELVVQIDARGNVISASGEASDSAADAARATITPDEATATAKSDVARQHRLDASALDATEAALRIFDPTLIGADGADARLVWQLDVTNADRTVDEYVLVDATSGAIALRFSQVEHSHGTTLPAGSRVCNAGTTAARYPCQPNSLGKQTHSAVKQTRAFMRDYHAFFLHRFGRNSIDGAGMPLISTVRYCGGSCASLNAYWDGKQAVFWPGMATDDVVAHEFAHGFTEHTSGLLYYHQSGAINEALSDIFGELVDLTNGSASDTPTTRWQIGDASSAGVIRDMQDPELYGQPDRMGSSGWWVDESDSYGVHTNSGVANKAAYLMVDGGAFNGHTIAGLGIDKTAAIWFRVATQYLWSGSDYADLGAALNQACTDLVGTTPLNGSGVASAAGAIDPDDCVEVADAVAATEMADPPAAPGAVAPTPPDCTSGTPTAPVFRDTFDTGDFTTSAAEWTRSSTTRWDVSDDYTDAPGYTLWGRTPSGAGLARVERDLGTLGANSFLTFDHAYILDHGGATYYDGGLVEYSVDGGTSWTDARYLFTHNGYNGTITSGWGNPLSGRNAFVGWSPGHVRSRIDLSNLAGETVRLRFVTGTDVAYEDAGWFVDDVTLYACDGAADETPPLLTLPNADFRTGVDVSGAEPVKLNVSFSAVDVGDPAPTTALERRTNAGSWTSLGSDTSVDVGYVTSTTKARQFRARAVDAAGNDTGFRAAPAFKVLAFQNGSTAITQPGNGWTTESSDAYYGGSVRYASVSGKKQILTRKMSDVAIVTTLGPDRGKFDVYIDGELVTDQHSVDTYSATTQHRQVVFAWDFGDAATHTIELRVLGTGSGSGTRVDFDAFLVLAP